MYGVPEPYDTALLGSFTQSFSLLTLETNPRKQADAEGRAMYLESSSVKNNAYYKKFGFEAKRDIHLGLSVDDNNSIGGDANSRSSTSLSSSSSSSSSDSESGPKPAVTLTVMVREPRRKLANSIPIKLSGGFVGGGGGGKQ